MRKRNKGDIIIIITAVLSQLYFLHPWIQGSEKSYNGVTYLGAIFRHESATELLKQEFPRCIELGGNLGALSFQFTGTVLLMFAAQVLSIFVLIGILRGRFLPKCSAVMFFLGFVCFLVVGINVSPAMDDSYISNSEILTGSSFYYPYFSMFVTGLLFLVMRLVDAWDKGARKAKAERKERKAYRKERRRRLHFPGNYSKLYYRFFWKDLLFRWKDMSFLFLSVFLSGVFIFIGFGIYQVFSNNYGEDGGMLGLGLVEIMRDFLIAIVLVSLFLIALTLSFYHKRKLISVGIIQTLGIRSQTLVGSWVMELTGCFAAAIMGAFVIGTVLLELLCRSVSSWMPGYEKSGTISFSLYLWTIGIMLMICGIAYLVSKELGGKTESTDTRNLVARWEKISGKYTGLTAVLAAFGSFACLWFYAERRMAESLLLVGLLLLCSTLLYRSCWGLYLSKKQKRAENSIPALPKNYRIRYRFRTITRYISLLTFVNLFILAIFSIKFVSNQIATPAETLYPYDYVFLACSQDDRYFEQLEKECQALVFRFPMVRATTLDATEEPDEFGKTVLQQGQNIGVSESTYRELKELAGETVADLDLDEKGEKVYVVYQQDQALKAKPLDWYQWTKDPYVHIGQALMGQNRYTRRETYPPREIVGAETGSLIGTYRQGRYENIIVFSDAYFETVKDSWKTTNLMTGKPAIKEEAETMTHEWPTQLALVNIPEEYNTQTDTILADFRANHGFDEDFDPLVKSAYSSETAIEQRKIERQTEYIANGMVLLMLLAAQIFLLRMKIEMDIPEIKRDYQFLEILGMRTDERIYLEKREVSRFVWIPLGIGALLSLILTGIVFKLRMYQAEDILNYMKHAIVIWGGCAAIQFINLKFLQREVIRKLEGNSKAQEK